MADNSNKKKAGIAIALLLVAGGIAYSRMQKLTPGPAINNGVSSDFGGPEMQADFKKVAEEAKITPEQQKKMEEFRDKGDFRQAMDVMTTDQRQIMFQQFRSRRQQQETKMQAALGDQYQRYQEKRQEQRGRYGGGGGRGGGGQGGPNNRNNGGGPRS